MKAIFLDVDGVINSEECKDTFGDYVGVNDNLVLNLSKIVSAFSPRPLIVLTSTWKLLWDNQPIRSLDIDPMAKYLVDKLAKAGLNIADRTVDKSERMRGHGIKSWLRKVSDIDGWVVLDDEFFPDYKECGIMPHLVRTNPNSGLSDEDVERAIKILRGE